MNVGSGLPDFQCLSSASGSSVMAGRKNKGAAAYGELAAALLKHWKSGKPLPTFTAEARPRR
ncbi:hypothetical protein MAHJHV51_56810 [Mycobacterium avium subsp. hominissuis]